MLMRVIHFVRLPLVLILIWAVMRFLMGPVFNQPYAPRGNAAFSVVAVTLISCLIYGAMSGRVGGFGWLGSVLCGATLGLWAQILIFTATLVSFAANLNTYFVHWDALNLPEGTTATMAQGMTPRAGGLVIGTLLGGVAALIGRAVLAWASPGRAHEG